jgi:hypothetical protein
VATFPGVRIQMQPEEELGSLVQAFMRGLLQLPKHVMSYFLHPWVAYAVAQ